MENKYLNGKIYKIVDVGYTKCYIGCTIQTLSVRMSGHRSKQKALNNLCNSRMLFDEFGMDNCKIELIENFPCQSKEELNKREGFFIMSTECVNKHMTGMTKSEYDKDYREKHSEELKAFDKARSNNPERLEYASNYRKTHKDERNLYSKNIMCQTLKL